jgi:hypothetical protein
VPFVVRLLAAMVSVAVPPVVMLVVENEAVMRLLEEVALSVTAWLEPVTTAVWTVEVVELPATVVPEEGLSVSEKSLGAFTVKV